MLLRRRHGALKNVFIDLIMILNQVDLLHFKSTSDFYGTYCIGEYGLFV